MIDFYTTPESAIWLTLAIAHEFWHSLQRQLGLIQSHAEAEDMADFVAGYTMKVLDPCDSYENDVATALSFFASIGVPEDMRDWIRVHDTPEWRMSHIMRWYMSDRELLKKKYFSIILYGNLIQKSIIFFSSITISIRKRILKERQISAHQQKTLFLFCRVFSLSSWRWSFARSCIYLKNSISASLSSVF